MPERTSVVGKTLNASLLTGHYSNSKPMDTKKKELKKILFSHSAGPQYGKGKGSYDLVKYLKAKLSDEFEVLFPAIERPSAPTYKKYKKMFASVFNDITEPIILVGHSLGASTLLKYLSEEEPEILIAGLFLVATPHWKSNMKEFQLREGFQTSLKSVPSIFLYHSRKDTEVPFEHLGFYEKRIRNATVRKLPGKQHLFSKGLPELVSDIKTMNHGSEQRRSNRIFGQGEVNQRLDT